MEAGAAVFAARGYHAARVDDIVKAAATSHGTFYLYFSSKQDLFRAIAIDVAAAMVDLARDLPVLDAGADAGARYHAWLEEFAALYARHGAFLQTWTEAEIVDSDFGRIGDDLVLQFSRELARRVRAAAPDLDAGIAAFALVSMIERMLYLVEAKALPVERPEALATLAAATIAALHGSPQPG
jgi:AcrR family transcriptional regulator